MEILFVRHGQTEWNVLNRVQGSVDIELNEVGKSQAHDTEKLLKDEQIDLIISSPLKRTVETANIINEGRNIPIVIDNGVVERSFGVYEGKDRKTIDFGIFWNRFTNEPIEDGECLSDFLDRINNFLKRLKENYEGKRVLIVSHGGVSMAMQYIFNGPDEDGHIPKGVKNCEVVKFNY